MMKQIYSLIIILFLILGVGCKYDSVTPPPVYQEDYSFPGSTNFSITLYANNSIYKVGDVFDLKIVFYNMDQVFGAAVEVFYDSSLVEISDSSKILIGPFFKTGDSTLVLKKTEQEHSRLNVAISYIKGSGLLSSGSGVVFKVKCKARKSGTANFSINTGKLEIRKSDGTFINNFSSLMKENLSIVLE